MIKLIKSLFFVVVISGCLSAQAGDLTAQTSALGGISEYSETILINAIEKIQNQRIDEALSDLEELVNINPKFSLAQLIYADLLTAKSNKVTDFGNYYNAPYYQIDALRNEAKARWDYHNSRTDQKKIPVSLVQMAENQEYAIVVDLSISRLFLFSNYNGVPKLIKDFYISTGKNGIGKLEEGDQKTPTGVYFVTDFIDPEELPDLYGDGAFPINYPNVVDKRFGRTGYGIWLHGTPSATYSRPPRDSDGCIILTNQDLNFISKYIELGTTPVVLAEKLEWTAIDDWKKRRQQFVQYIEQWRKDWESRDADRYLRHYSREYSGLGKNYESWVEYKRRVNPSKRFIKIGLSDTSIFLYPGDQQIMVVTFVQDYASDNFHRRYTKRQYWKMEKDGTWRIVYEGSIS